MSQVNLPQNPKLEVLCLGAILNSINAANEAFSTLDDSDFFETDHKKIFSLMKSTYSIECGCNVSTMVQKIDKQEGNYSRDYLIYLDSNAWSGMPHDEYFADLRNLSGLRKSCYAAQELLIKACSPGAIYDDVIGNHQSNILRTMGINTSSQTPNNVYKNFKKEMSFVDYSIWRRERFLKGLPVFDGVSSGYPLLDKVIGSFQNSRLYYIGARTSMGKTTLILNFIANMMYKTRIGIFSLEMDTATIFEKLICIVCGMKYSDFSMGNCTLDQIEMIKSLEKSLERDSIFIEDESGMNISKMMARAKRMKQTYNIEILFIDYLTLLKADGKHPTKHMMVDEVSKGLQHLAKSLKIPVVCLAQLNRSAVGDPNDRPSLAHFRESGSIEEDADACLLIHRPEYYDKNSHPGLVELIVAKNRIMGSLGTLKYSCQSSVSEKYDESIPIQDEIKKANEKAFNDLDKHFGGK
jgi:replicative DNA helicase